MEVKKEQIAEWKAKYGDVYKVSADNLSGYLHAPSRKALGYASMVGKENPLKFNEVILNECWIDGDDELRTNDAYFLGLSEQLAALIQVKQVELTKL